MRARGDERVLYVLPDFVGRSAEIRASWTAAASLASALGNQIGAADVLTPIGLLSPDGVVSHALRENESSPARTAVRRLPATVRLGLGDAQGWWRGRQMRELMHLVKGRRYRLVIQLHRRFQDCGIALGRRLGVPAVLRLDALEVREETAWGIHRPWGAALERIGELSIVRRADLVASVSPVLDANLADVGIDPEKREVLPNGVDVAAFSPGRSDDGLREDHALKDRFVLGWVGGFRPYHGLEAIPEIARTLGREVPEAVICLVGTGPLRDQVAREVAGLHNVRLVDPVVHGEVARWIRTFDACLLMAEPGAFHYSPLKLYEYLACARPVVAAQAGEVSTVLSEVGGLLVQPGDPRGVVGAVKRLAASPELARELGHRGRSYAERFASWDARARHLLDTLASRGLLDRGNSSWTSLRPASQPT